ncbi:Anp1-domain-containing protein [Scheffersomyces amazonensis]|uniref:Anp1-domain-containing protein n=1 Tax=Scheffersomyces amazonensis TaxID=1078765 RepID=UPI00315D51E0
MLPYRAKSLKRRFLLPFFLSIIVVSLFSYNLYSNKDVDYFKQYASYVGGGSIPISESVIPNEDSQPQVETRNSNDDNNNNNDGNFDDNANKLVNQEDVRANQNENNVNSPDERNDQSDTNSNSNSDSDDLVRPIRQNYIKKQFTSPHSSFKRIEYYRKEEIPVSQKTVLILVNIGQKAAYGRDRTFSDFMDTLSTLYETPYKGLVLSIGFLSNIDSEFQTVHKYFEDNVGSILQNVPFISRISLYSNSDLEVDGGFTRQQRQKDEFQRFRRRLIAKNRNFLVNSALQDEQYILFLDADIVRFEKPDKIIPTFIQSEKDILVPRIVKGGLLDFDKNSWRGERTKPTETQLELFNAGKYDDAKYVPKDVESNMFHFQNFVAEDKYKRLRRYFSYNTELDSVGGAVLFTKSIVFRLGAIFPTSYIVGTTWDRTEGYDGIETEGLCYLAKPLGFRCWGFPNIVAYHAER